MLPEPSQVLAAVNVVPLHDPSPSVVPEANCSQTPPAAQLPSLPQVPFAAHWPEGAAVPAVKVAQVPSAEPVSASVHAMQGPLQAVAQQTPPTQKPLVHWSAAVHAPPLACAGAQMPALQ